METSNPATPSGTAPPAPPGPTPHLTVAGAAAAIDFYKAAFGGIEQMRLPAQDGQRLMFARLEVNGQALMLSDHFAEAGGDYGSGPPNGPQAVTLHLQVADADAVFAQAVAAGATPLMPPADMFWGDRYGRLRDPFGFVWSIAHTLPA